MKKKLISIFLVISVVFTTFFSYNIVEAANVTWYYVQEGNILIIIDVDIVNSGTDVVIPAHINNIRVETIASYCFFGNSKIRSVTIPPTIKEIGDYAFSDCKFLNYVTFQGSKVDYLGSHSFSGCSSLKSIHLPTVAIMGFSTFLGCYSLETAIIDSVNDIAPYAFQNCSRLKSIEVKSGLEEISYYSFNGCGSLVSIYFPSTLKTIEHNAFEKCSKLTYFNFPNVTSFGWYAFLDCTSLTSFKLSDELTSITSSMFRNCTSLGIVNLPPKIESIADRAFEGCSSLVSIVCSSKVASFSVNAVPLTIQNLYFTGEAPVIPSNLLPSDNSVNIYYPKNSLNFNNTTFPGCVLIPYSTEKVFVNFETLGGSLIETCELSPLSLLTPPPIPNKTDYKFIDWYKDPDFKKPYSFKNELIAVNSTLYAKWNLHKVSTNYYDDFEKENDNWKFNSWSASSNIRISPNEGMYDSKCLVINQDTQGDGYPVRKVMLYPGERYTLKAKVCFYLTTGNNVSIECGNFSKNTTRFVLDGFPAYQWNDVSFDFLASPLGETDIVLRLGYFAATCTGTVRFDDISIEQVIPVTPTPLPIPFITPNPALMNIQIGDYISVGKYYREPIIWRCVGIDENGPLMLSDRIIAIKAFDADGVHYYCDGTLQSDSNGARKSNGSNVWEASNMRSWLNSFGPPGRVYWEGCCPPYKDMLNLVSNGYVYDYSSEKGFLAEGNFTDTEIKAMQIVTHKVLIHPNDYEKIYSGGGPDDFIYDQNIGSSLQNYENARYQLVTDTMFIPDIKQLNQVYQNANILGEDYYKAKPTQKAVLNSLLKNTAYNPDEYWGYWINTPNVSSASLRGVHSDGSVKGFGVSNSTVGVRPAFYLNMYSGIFESGNGSKDIPYVVINSPPTPTPVPTASPTLTPTPGIIPTQPPAPIVNSVIDTDKQISGKSVKDGVVIVTIGSTKYLPSSISGSWKITFPKALKAGTKIMAKVTCNNASSDIKIVYVKPAAPKVFTIRANNRYVKGAATKGAYVYVTTGGKTYSNKSNLSTGAFSVKVSKLVKGKTVSVYCVFGKQKSASKIIKII